MESFAFMVIAIVLFMQSWAMIRRLTDLKVAGLIGAASAIGLGYMALNPSLNIVTNVNVAGPDKPLHAVAIAVMIVGFALYSAALAGVGLWGFDDRPLGFLSLLLAVMMVLYALYFVAGLNAGAVVISTLSALGSLILAVIFGLIFFYTVPPFRQIEQLTGWFLLIGSALVFLIPGALVVMGILDLAT